MVLQFWGGASPPQPPPFLRLCTSYCCIFCIEEVEKLKAEVSAKDMIIAKLTIGKSEVKEELDSVKDITTAGNANSRLIDNTCTCSTFSIWCIEDNKLKEKEAVRDWYTV